MTQQATTSIENNFTKGLITESTGLNFPENAATDTDNCTFTLIGDVTRREGINYEANKSFPIGSPIGQAINTYKWNNVGGDGLTQIVVEQVGSNLYFFLSSSASIAVPLSSTRLATVVDVSQFIVINGVFDPTVECQFTDGNGYLFIYHPNCDPFYCSYANGVITPNMITIQIRDFVGIPEGTPDNLRPLTLSTEHKYNLQNQGWISGNPWSGFSTTTNSIATGAKTFTIATGLTGIVAGQNVTATVVHAAGLLDQYRYMVGTVTSYTSATGSIVLSITSIGSNTGTYPSGPFYGWSINPTTTGYINTWFSAIGNYPSNADQWWSFKNSTDVFDPATTLANTSIGSGPAPKGSVILNAFQQSRSAVSGIAGITDVTTTVRPRTGTWFQGRVWYTGVDASFNATGDQPYSTWTENIYFSQIVQSPVNFGQCYQQNDPSSEGLFDLLATDGGVITIQGCGPIYKLFPLQNAMLVFAANGVWYITGSSGIGFTANDYTVVKLSGVKSISCTSFVDINGLPMFWNEEGIYKVEPAKQGTSLLSTPLHVNPLEVNPITIGTILTFYNNIPLSSKKYARAAYNPIEYIVQWLYKSTEATDVTSRYQFDKILNFNTSNSAFFPYTIATSTNTVNGIIYVSSPGGTGAPQSIIKYVASSATAVSFAEENDATYVDWGGPNYVSYFVTGYKLKGQAIKKFQPQYIQVYCRTNNAPSSYKIQGIWDFANTGDSNRWSSMQLKTNALTYFDTIYNRHKIRGHGYALQFKVSSVDGMPFDVQGWAVVDTVNTGT